MRHIVTVYALGISSTDALNTTQQILTDAQITVRLPVKMRPDASYPGGPFLYEVEIVIKDQNEFRARG